MSTRVGIINVTGYAGAELARLLHRHPEVDLVSITGRSAAGGGVQNMNLMLGIPETTGLEALPVYP